MASPNKNILKKNFETKKQFVYEQGNVKLDFTLNVGIKTNLVDWIALLKQAQIDCQAEIDNNFNDKNNG